MRHTRILACLLTALLIAPTLIACSDTENSDPGADTSAIAENVTDAETEEADPFLGFDYEGRDFRIWTSAYMDSFAFDFFCLNFRSAVMTFSLKRNW